MQGYSLPFNQNDKVLELGGGQNAVFHPNLDIREGPGVDIVADLNEPLPIESESYYGVFCQFLLEHLRVPRLRPFISEVHRILTPEGIAVIITANLLEQAKVLIEREEWNDDLIQMVYGGNPDYPENYHHLGLSPQYAIKLFREAGFHTITIFEHPVAMQIWGRSTDMIIEARKSGARIGKLL